MSDTAILYGATVEYTTDGGTNYENLPEAKGVAIPTVQKEYRDVTNLDSPDRFREFIPGLKDAGVVAISCNYTPAGYAAMKALDEGNDKVGWRVTLPTMGAQSTAGDVFTFDAFVTASVDQVDNVEAEPMMNVELRTTGGVDHTPGS